MERFEWERVEELFDDPSVKTIAEQLSVTRRTIHRWRQVGTVDWIMADKIACTLGYHISNIWPEWWTSPEEPLPEQPARRNRQAPSKIATPVERELLLALYRSAVSYEELCDIFDCSRTTVWRRLAQLEQAGELTEEDRREYWSRRNYEAAQ